MNGLRPFLLRHRNFGLWLVGAALLLKALIPAGYMIGTSHGAVSIELCSGYAPARQQAAMPGMAHGAMAGMDHRRHAPDQPAKDMPCAFSALTAVALAATDPLLLADAIGFIVVSGFRIDAGVPQARAPAFLRPPLRGPPATA